MGTFDSCWPDFQSDVAASTSWARTVSSRQRPPASLTHDELITLVNQLAGHVKELSLKLDSQEAGSDQDELAQHRAEVRAHQADVVEYVQSFSEQFGQLQNVIQAQIEESQQIVQHDVSQLARRQRKAEAEVIRLRSGHLGEVDSRTGDNPTGDNPTGDSLTMAEAVRLRQELLAETTQVRHMVQESHQIAEKAIHRATLAADSNDALQAEFDAAQVQVEHRSDLVNKVCQHLEARIDSTEEQLNERITETVQDTIARLSHLDALAAAQETRRKASVSATSARLHELEARLAEFEGLEPIEAPTAKRTGPPPTWQFERRNNDRRGP